MGSRKQNFYNQLVQRYGFEDAAREVQDLYLEGKKDEAAAALPDELIDRVALVGPKDVVRERIRVFRDSGVGTLGVSPFASTKDERLEQLRLLAELADAAWSARCRSAPSAPPAPRSPCSPPGGRRPRAGPRRALRRG